MVPVPLLALAAQLALTPPDTSLLRAVAIAIDTIAVAEGKRPLTERTFLVDVDRFFRMAGVVQPSVGISLPAGWRRYDQTATPPCRTNDTPCILPGEVRVMIGGVERDKSTGSVRIHGGFTYYRNPPASKERMIPVGADSPIRFRNFAIVLAIEAGAWRVVELSVGEAA